MNQEMPTFDVSDIPSEFNPLTAPLDQRDQNKGDDKLFIQFRTEAVMNPFKSTQAGRPIFDDIDMIIIRTPGSQLTSVIAPVKRYMDRFGTKYRAWKEGRKEIESGTPLEVFPYFFNKPSGIAELKAMNIHTVEQLADLPDSGKQKLMGGFELCQRAQDWLKKTDLAAADAEKEATNKRIAELEALVKSLSTKTPPPADVAKAVTKG